jgi:two-component system, chemotaxis family, chemotaxis protein CheV
MSDQEILLESGTNEVEIAELILGSQHFGVNVAKIKEFVQYDRLTITKPPGRHPSVQGVFLLRDKTVPLI